jgi:hypothetical protein
MSDDKKKLDEAATLSIDQDHGADGIVSTTFTAPDQAALARLLQLAGRPADPIELESAKRKPMGYVGVWGGHHHHDHEEPLSEPIVDLGGDGGGMGESIGDHDFGDNLTSRKGEVVDIDFPSTIGKADAKVRYVPARSGDNPLAEDLESVKSFRDYLKETEEAIEEASASGPQFRFGPPQYLLPTYTNANYEELINDDYLGAGLEAGDENYWVIVVGKENNKNDYTPRYCGSHGSAHEGVGAAVTIVHDQTRGQTAGKILYQFSGAQYMNPEMHQQIAVALHNAGVDTRKRYACKVYK